MINYVKFNSLTLRAKGGVMKLLFKMFISQGRSGSSFHLVRHRGSVRVTSLQGAWKLAVLSSTYNLYKVGAMGGLMDDLGWEPRSRM